MNLPGRSCWKSVKRNHWVDGKIDLENQAVLTTKVPVDFPILSGTDRSQKTKAQESRKEFGLAW